MVKIIITLLLCTILYSCSAPYYKLLEGKKVLKNKYKNIKYFDPNIYKSIDINYFYIVESGYLVDNKYKKKRDIDVAKYVLQFYENGRVRFLYYMNADPKKTGRRGIIYKKNNKIKIDTDFANQGGTISKGSYSVKIEGDYIFLLDDNFLVPGSEYICFVYKKSDEKVPEEWKKYPSDW